MRIIIGKTSKLVLLLLVILVSSCRNNVGIRDLTGHIMLPEISDNNDTVDFYIKQIKLFKMDGFKPRWVMDSSDFELHVTIKNKLDKKIYLVPTDLSFVYFVGILPSESNNKTDTINFVNFFQDVPQFLEPKSSVDVEVSSSYLDEDKYGLTNIDSILGFIQNMKFYYAPLSMEKDMGPDTVVIDRKHRLRTDANTKITALRMIR